MDRDGKIHTEPFKLNPKNYIALKIYDDITAISTMEEIQKKKGDSIYTIWFPSLSAIDIVLSSYHDQIENEDMAMLLRKLGEIHHTKLQQRLAKV